MKIINYLFYKFNNYLNYKNSKINPDFLIKYSKSFQWRNHSVINSVDFVGHHNYHIICQLHFFLIDSIKFGVWTWHFLNVFVQVSVMFIWFFQVFDSLCLLLTHHSRKCFCNVKLWVNQTSVILLISFCILILLQNFNYLLKVSDGLISNFVHLLHFSLTWSSFNIQNHKTLYTEQVVINLWHFNQYFLPCCWICFWIQVFQQRFQKLSSFL